MCYINHFPSPLKRQSWSFSSNMSPLGFVKACCIEQLSATPLLQRTTVSNRTKTDLNVNISIWDHSTHTIWSVWSGLSKAHKYKISVCMMEQACVWESMHCHTEPCDCKGVIIYVRIVCISQNKESYLIMCPQYMLVLYVCFYGLDQLYQYRIKLHM